MVHTCTKERWWHGCVSWTTVVGAHAVVAAGAVVLAGTVIGDGELWAGVPAKSRGKVSEELRTHLASTSERYVEYASWMQQDES